MLPYRVLRFLRHEGIFISVLLSVALAGGGIAGTVVLLSRPQTEARPQIVERTVVVMATSAPARASTPTTAPVVVTPTAVPPTAVPAPTARPPQPTPTPIQAADMDATLKFGETWVGQGLSLTLLQL